jgi:cysteine desulfurase
MMPKPIYLDYNATTPHDPEVIAAMRPFLEDEFGNPSSSHSYGIPPHKAVMEARRQVASLLNCRPQGLCSQRCRCTFYPRWCKIG